MKKTLLSTMILALLTTYMGCDLQQEVDLNLPEYEPQIVAESYLQVGQPPVITLTRSASFFEDIQLEFIRDAEVTLEHRGEIDTLVPFEIDFTDPDLGGVIDSNLIILLEPLFGSSLYIYTSLSPLPEDYNSEYRLGVRTLEDETISATTFIPPPVPIDSIVIKFDEDSMAAVQTYFFDPPGIRNYYRYSFRRRVTEIITDGSGNTDTVRTETIDQDFFLDDELTDGETIVVGTLFEYEPEDSVIIDLYSVTEAYFDFGETVQDAITANLSPFGQPTLIQSNVNGGTGIFTGVSQTQEQRVIP
ncbi:DUF4249 domain-containing protein [Pontibacter sp. G13]|uniref:DUF4249 domain-containing protein n=1 Tax=Pontibacter sp. G13 TaxID=3074898 RepID=UPI00288A0F75|nr:DUF4249 domain-containing protein [Pontibacter sp. G13]WNJ16851.1 DUF4249 domain-containing protein [Pontibacter sp. G13]